MLPRLRARPEWTFFAALYRAAPALTLAWWVGLVLRGLLPVALGVLSGVLIAAVSADAPLLGPLALLGAAFVSLQVLTPLHQALSTSLGRRTADHFYEVLLQGCLAPPGILHLEDAELARDIAVARDFDLGMTGPPLSILSAEVCRR